MSNNALQIKTKTRLTNGDQYNRLVEFMVENPNVPLYNMVKTAKDRFVYNTAWENLSVQLNMRGPPMRTMEEWKKVWKDYKYHIKKKCFIKQKIEQNKATGGPANYKKINFSNNELAIIKILNLQAPITARKRITYSTTPITKCTSRPHDIWKPTTPPIIIHEDDYEPSKIKTELSEMVFEITNVTEGIEFIDTNSIATSLPKSAGPSNVLPESIRDVDLVEEQVELEQEIRNLKKEKVKILRQTAEINQRHLELKEKMLELKEKKFEMKCLQYKDDCKYKIQKLELKKRELELKEMAKLRKEKHNYV